MRLIGAAGEQVGIIEIDKALRAAVEAELDLVEMNPNAEPPVCRIMDYGKFQFQVSKKKAVTKKKQRQVQIKELKYRPGIEEGDYVVKLRKLIAFLEQGDKVKVTIRFRGREVSHNELGFKLLQRLEADLQEHGLVEQSARFEGKQVVMVVGPKKK